MTAAAARPFGGNIKDETKKVFKSPDGVYWGKITKYGEHNAYVTPRKRKHWCRRYEGWGIQIEVFAELDKYDVHVVIIETKDEVGDTVRYVSTYADWVHEGVTDTLRLSDGEQRFLPHFYFFEERRLRQTTL